MSKTTAPQAKSTTQTEIVAQPNSSWTESIDNANVILSGRETAGSKIPKSKVFAHHIPDVPKLGPIGGLEVLG